MEPGIYRDISNEDYHRGPGLSSSTLKKIARSPAHSRVPGKGETEAMIKGTATHCAVFEPERFMREYICEPEEVNRRTKAGRAEIEALSGTGKIVLKRKVYDEVLKMAEAVRSHPLAGEFVTDGIAEQAAYWLQRVEWGGTEETKILCKCRPDYVIEFEDGEYVIVDLKTTQDSRPAAFQRNAYWDYGYHISAAHYVTGMTAITGRPPKDFVFVTVEPEEPYGVIVYRASRPFLTLGFAENESLYKVYAGCLRSGEWPGYPAIIHELNLPRGV